MHAVGLVLMSVAYSGKTPHSRWAIVKFLLEVSLLDVTPSMEDGDSRIL